ncbi:hypothetical protein FQA39_LY01773 [Lamprigera yunnana]|nr:hypothetical protein FQA39_LY01773 [Lamprigera yunnana]
MFNIDGKVALVTGGASGIGLACVKELLKHGAKGVTVADINKESATKIVDDLNQEFGNDKVLLAEVDVTDKKQFESGFRLTIEKFKNLDIVVNNAGIFDEQNWEKTIAVNVNGGIIGNLLALEKYIPLHKSGAEGVIINICSTACFLVRGWNPIYATTKFGLLGLSRSLGIEHHYKRTKIKVISILPGFTVTSMVPNLDHLHRSKEYHKIYEAIKPTLILQPSSHVGFHIAKLIGTAKSGSAWVIEDSKDPYEVEFPSAQQLRKKSNLQ